MVDWLQRLETLARRPACVIGLLSGTSADGIDAAVCRITPPPDLQDTAHFRVELLRHSRHPHDEEVHAWIAGADSLGARRLAEMHRRLGLRFGQACLDAMTAAGLSPGQVDLVGSHGQTLYHHSQVPGAERCTLQVGDGDHIAELTGLPVVSDFRAQARQRIIRCRR